MQIFHRFYFEAARKLPNLPQSHPCASVHGHSFTLTVYIEGEPDAKHGWIIDFSVLKRACEGELKLLDHRFLNDVEGLANPTTENICEWLWLRLAQKLPQLAALKLKETRDAGCLIRRRTKLSS